MIRWLPRQWIGLKKARPMVMRIEYGIGIDFEILRIFLLSFDQMDKLILMGNSLEMESYPDSPWGGAPEIGVKCIFGLWVHPANISYIQFWIWEFLFYSREKMYKRSIRLMDEERVIHHILVGEYLSWGVPLLKMILQIMILNTHQNPPQCLLWCLDSADAKTSEQNIGISGLLEWRVGWESLSPFSNSVVFSWNFMYTGLRCLGDYWVLGSAP